MILGVGTDLVEIDRVRKACERDSFVVRTFTELERRQAGGKISRFAGSFAVKEAVAKALGTGFRAFMPIDIEVARDELGKPYVNLYRGARALAHELGVERIEVSISNTAEHAMAFAVAEGAPRAGEKEVGG
ncbi:holo-ACP synthase [Enterocloster lavalensis]|uniref:holo-ACP synthase n=1 Tax=Enterocloster lavalensis TaxID=460384 RepID=UPI0023F40D93|nr:holo-ACP synthase [Enterocloster lavalensis]